MIGLIRKGEKIENQPGRTYDDYADAAAGVVDLRSPVDQRQNSNFWRATDSG